MDATERGTKTSKRASLQRRDDLVGHVLGLDQLDAARVLQPRGQLGVDDDGHDAGDLDAGAAQLGAQGLAQPHHVVLGPAVGAAAREAALAGGRGDVDDVAAAAGEHPRDDLLDAEHHAVDVDVDHPLGGGVVLVPDRVADLHDPRVVDQDVDRAELRLGAVEEVLDRRALGHVELEGDGAVTELLGGLLGGREVEVADGDLHALAQEGLRGGAADAAGGAGDRGDLAGEDAVLLGHGTDLSGKGDGGVTVPARA